MLRLRFGTAEPPLSMTVNDYQSGHRDFQERRHRELRSQPGMKIRSSGARRHQLRDRSHSMTTHCHPEPSTAVSSRSRRVQPHQRGYGRMLRLRFGTAEPPLSMTVHDYQSAHRDFRESIRSRIHEGGFCDLCRRDFSRRCRRFWHGEVLRLCHGTAVAGSG